MQRRYDPETNVNKPFQNVSCQGRIQNFLQGGGTNFRDFFKSSFFPAELVLSYLNNKNDSRGVRRHAPPKNFENLHTVMAILVLFEQFSGKVCSYLWPLCFECFKYDAFCSHVSFDYAFLRRLRHIVMKRFEIIEKFHSSKALLKMAGGRDASPPLE